jgi:ankyrin repeat protein
MTSALFQAAAEGDRADVEELLGYGVNPNAVYDEDTKLTALHAAAMMANDAGYEIAEVCMK